MVFSLVDAAQQWINDNVRDREEQNGNAQSEQVCVLNPFVFRETP